MKKKEYTAYFILAIFLFSLLNFPHLTTHSIRSFCIPKQLLFASNYVSDTEMDLMRLEIENRALKEQISQIQNWLGEQERIEQHIKLIEELSHEQNYSDFYKRRLESLTNLLKMEVHSIEAKVIFRDPALWSSGLWINVGHRNNQQLKREIIAKNSPVILGSALVGVVEKVEFERSYVRLITDVSLTPAVRAIRGNEQNQMLLDQIAFLVEQLKIREDLHLDNEIFEQLKALEENLLNESTTHYLAKGELCGSNTPLWRCMSTTLKGIGFNYEFSDKEGAARELHLKKEVPLLNLGDLLITSGLDGVFPEGLHVATVSKIHPLKEGGNSYDIEAKSAIVNLNELTHVQVCPPIR